MLRAVSSRLLATVTTTTAASGTTVITTAVIVSRAIILCTSRFGGLHRWQDPMGVTINPMHPLIRLIPNSGVFEKASAGRFHLSRW
jgi:hypothetical protein